MVCYFILWNYLLNILIFLERLNKITRSLAQDWLQMSLNYFNIHVNQILMLPNVSNLISFEHILTSSYLVPYLINLLFVTSYIRAQLYKFYRIPCVWLLTQLYKFYRIPCVWLLTFSLLDYLLALKCLTLKHKCLFFPNQDQRNEISITEYRKWNH